MSLTDNCKLGLLIVAYILMGHNTSAQNNNVGIGTNSPDASAILELQATDKGILIPRTDTNLIVSPATGLLIYENADNTFYYFDGTSWVPFGSGTPGPPGPQGPPGADGALNAWSLTGNAGTSPPTNFIGTTDANDWVIQTNSSERVRVMSGGRIGVNMSAPVYQLDVATGALGIRSQITDFSSTAIYGYNTDGTGGFGIVGQSDGNTPGWAGVRAVAENGSDALITDGPSHFNIDGQDFDMQVEGLTDANLLYSDASTDRIGIGTATPDAKLEVAGQVKITGGAPGTGKVLTSDAVGLATWVDLGSNTYGTNNQGVTGTTDITTNTATWATIPQMSITFTPIHSTVYANFTIDGDLDNFGIALVRFRLRKDGVVIAGTATVCEDYDYDDLFGEYQVASWNGSIIMPINVTAGVPTTIDVQWNMSSTLYAPVVQNLPATSPLYHRSLLIID